MEQRESRPVREQTALLALVLVLVVFGAKYVTDFVLFDTWTDPRASVPSGTVIGLCVMGFAALAAVGRALRSLSPQSLGVLISHLTPVQQAFLLWSITATLRTQGEEDLADRVARLAEYKEKATSSR